MSDAKRNILARLKQSRRDDVQLPEPLADVTTYDDPRQKFAEVLASVGGTVLDAEDLDDAREKLQQLPVLHAARTVVSHLPELAASTPGMDSVEDAHQLASVDLAICPGEFWVAENGAVWVTDRRVQHRVVLFLSQHLILVVPGDQFVHHMHDAYRRIGSINHPFGGFISGPSKTADIEQSLVIGAHGARSLYVVRIG